MKFISTQRVAAVSSWLFVLTCSIATAKEAGPPKADGVSVISTQKIWDGAAHNAFTDLIHWRGQFYCSFREATAHSSYDGSTRILVSRDGKSWEPLALFAENGLDLRDPKLCILPDGRLLVGMGVRRQVGKDAGRWETRSRVYLSEDGKKWEGPHAVGDPGIWMWRFVTHGNNVFSIGYVQLPAKGPAKDTFLRMYRSKDGVKWETVSQTDAGGGYVNEAAFGFEPTGRCVVLLRREGGSSRLGLAEAPYTQWTWTDLKERFNGPALLRLPDGRLLAGGRSKMSADGSPKTALGWLTTDPPALRPILALPSQHETGYPGLMHHNGRVWASYYSSQSGKCAIYIAELEVTKASK